VLLSVVVVRVVAHCLGALHAPGLLAGIMIMRAPVSRNLPIGRPPLAADLISVSKELRARATPLPATRPPPLLPAHPPGVASALT
jgi:hypothetical protein